MGVEAREGGGHAHVDIGGCEVWNGPWEALGRERSEVVLDAVVDSFLLGPPALQVHRVRRDT